MNSKLIFVVLSVLIFYSYCEIAKNGCCTPKQWEAKAIQVYSLGIVEHSIHYDATNNRVRWDRKGNLETTGKHQILRTWLDYTTLNEYIYFVSENKCLLYGGDHFNEWCYGPKYVGQDYISSFEMGGQNVTMWRNFGNEFSWLATSDNCVPVMTQHNGDTTLFSGVTLGIRDPSVFTVPQICKSHELELKAKHGDDLWTHLKHNGCHE